MNQLYLTIAIVAEVIATSCLTASNGLTRLWPSLLTVAFYALAFVFLSLPLRTIPMGVVYAVWSGMGIVLISAIGWLVYRQPLDLPALVGIGFILAGVLIVNLFSTSVRH